MLVAGSNDRWRIFNLSGWIKIHRELIDKPIWVLSTPGQCKVLITLLMMVNWQPRKWEWKGLPFECQPGQCVTSLASVAERAGVTIQTVRGALLKFKKYDFATYETTKTGRLITICNWERYQDIEDTPQHSTQQSDNKATTTNEEVKKLKNTSLGGKKPKIPIKEIQELYNQHCPDMATSRNVGTKLEKQINARCKQKYLTKMGRCSDSLDFWEAYFKLCGSITWMNEESDQYRKKDLDFLTRDTTIQKVVDGVWR